MIVQGYPDGCIHCHRLNGEDHAENCAVLLGIAKSPLRIITTIPPEVEQYASEIARFIEAMVYKLGVKAYKGKWEGMPIQKALELLRDEEKELTEAVARGNMVEVLLEAADVANFALIASAIAMEKK